MPNWYATPGLVPTLNYAAVHVHGTPTALHDFVGAHAAMNDLVSTFENDETGNWSIDRLSDDRLRGQMKGIVAFEMPIARIECKVKMSQNRKPEDVQGAVAALEKSDNQDDRRTAAMMRAIHGA